MIDQDVLKRLTWDIPPGLDRTQKKEPINPELRKQIYERDKNTCAMCSKIDPDGYGSSNPFYVETAGRLQLHHIIPNGDATLDNLVTLCTHCHNIVHEILFVEGKWRYIKVR